MSKLDWIFEIKNYEIHLQNALKDRYDLKVVLDILLNSNGIKAFVELYEEFNKANVKFIECVITSLKKIYVLQNRKMPAEKIRQKIDIDPNTIYRWWRKGK